MRGLVCAVAALLFVSGQAQAAPLDIAPLAGQWRAPDGTCESPYLEAVERSFSADGVPTVWGAILVDDKLIRGDIHLDGPNKGKLVWEDTGKPALAVSAANGKMKLSVLDKATGLKTVQLELCPGTAPDFAGADRLQRELPGAWFESTADGTPRKSLFDVGVESCKQGTAYPDRRGAWTFKLDEHGRMLWSSGSFDAYSNWKAVDIQPQALMGRTWLKINFKNGKPARLVNFAPIPGTYRLRMLVVDVAPRAEEFMESCPAN